MNLTSGIGTGAGAGSRATRLATGLSTRAAGAAFALILRAILACGCLPAGLATAAPAVRDELPAARNLAIDAHEAARRGVPLVVLYTQTGCGWCERVRREHLIPLSREAQAPAIVRQVFIDRSDRLIDFQGRRTTSADFSRLMSARMAPTVMFHGPGGVNLAEPIVGFRLADFYGAYLERAITESQARLRGES